MIVFYIISALIAITAGLWVLIPISTGVPWRPTATDRIRAALKLADLKPGETLMDLGSGDGRVIILAAREFGARGIGIEAGPLQVLLAGWKARWSGVSSQVHVKRGNFYQADLREVDVVFAYLTSDQSPRLQRMLEKQLRPGTRVLTVAFDLPGWQPAAFDRKNLIFVYKMPPQLRHVNPFFGTQ